MPLVVARDRQRTARLSRARHVEGAEQLEPVRRRRRPRGSRAPLPRVSQATWPVERVEPDRRRELARAGPGPAASVRTRPSDGQQPGRLVLGRRTPGRTASHAALSPRSLTSPRSKTWPPRWVSPAEASYRPRRPEPKSIGGTSTVVAAGLGLGAVAEHAAAVDAPTTASTAASRRAGGPVRRPRPARRMPATSARGTRTSASSRSSVSRTSRSMVMCGPVAGRG